MKGYSWAAFEFCTLLVVFQVPLGALWMFRLSVGHWCRGLTDVFCCTVLAWDLKTSWLALSLGIESSVMNQPTVPNLFYLWSYVSFSVLVVREVLENPWNLSTVSLLLEKLNFKNPLSFLFRFEHAKLILILKCNAVPWQIFRGI